MAASNSPILLSGEKTVTAAGTAEALVAAARRVYSVLVKAKIGNTGQVYLGGSDVASGTNDGLDPGESVSLAARTAFDLADLFVDVDTSGEGVDFYAMKA